MDEENKIVPEGKIFTVGRLWVGAFLGGPLMAGYILYKNFRIFDDRQKAKMTIIITLLSTIPIFGVSALISYFINTVNNGIPVGIYSDCMAADGKMSKW